MTTAPISFQSSSVQSVTSREAWTMTIAIGFASTAALWGIGYFTFIGPGLAIGEVLFGLMLLLIVAGGVFGGRYRELTAPGSGSSAFAGMKIGLITAITNLLIMGSLIRDTGLVETFGWLCGVFIASMALGAVGGALGGRLPAVSRDRVPSALAVFSAVLACTVGMLLFSGGLVTGLEAGLAVPDWPNSFGHNMLLYPLRNWEGGIFYEHAHRLYGMLVGTGTLALMVLVFLNDSRTWLRGLSVVLLFMVIIQGIMGGLRVTEISTNLAIIHGVFGQLVFVTTVMVAAFTTTRWMGSTPPKPHESTENDRPLTISLLVILVVQLVLGACLRHLQVVSAQGDGLILPQWAMYLHITMGIIAFALAILVGLRAWGAYPDIRLVHRLGQAIMIVVGIQLVLGILALFVVLTRTNEIPPAPEVITTSLHQATGAFLLALAALLMIWHRRLLAPVLPSS
ncbi:MAG: COX15/CtaA family protein [Phycisphaerales bacterium]|nr:COX15/CtaA family protein [Phycisphaerales bacterium]